MHQWNFLTQQIQIFLNRSVEGIDWPAGTVRSLTQRPAWAGGAHTAGTLPQFRSCRPSPPALNTEPVQEEQTAQRCSREDGEATEAGPPPALKPRGTGACTHTHTHTHPPLPAKGNKRHRVGVDSGGEAPLGHSCREELGCLKTHRSQGLKPRGLWTTGHSVR